METCSLVNTMGFERKPFSGSGHKIKAAIVQNENTLKPSNE